MMNYIKKLGAYSSLCCLLAVVVFANIAFADSTSSFKKQISKLTKRVGKLEVTLQSSLSGKGSSGSVGAKDAATSWTGKIYKPAPDGIDEKDISVTFTATSETEGTWTSNPYSLTHPVDSFSSGRPTGTYSGSYRLIENSMFIFNEYYPDGTATGDACSIVVSVEAGSLLFSSFSSSLPSPLLQLSEVSDAAN